mmetsp:Transcript_16788/g.44186  ORF Transcript_16788/g.44186 Transcript_16788/m.44186 type:complete len:344 (+) Transcript_16788:173-1204(+)
MHKHTHTHTRSHTLTRTHTITQNGLSGLAPAATWAVARRPSRASSHAPKPMPSPLAQAGTPPSPRRALGASNHPRRKQSRRRVPASCAHSLAATRPSHTRAHTSSAFHVRPCPRPVARRAAPAACSRLVFIGERAPFGEGALEEGHADGVVLVDGAVEDALHVALGAKRLSDVALAPKLGVELDWLEPADVLRRVEHPADDRLLLVCAEGVARQQHLLEDDAVGVDREERAARDGDVEQGGALGRGVRRAREEDEEGRGAVEGRRVDGGDGGASRLEVALEAVLVGAPCVFRVDWLRAKLAEADVKDERLLAAQRQVGRLRLRGQADGEVDDRQAVLVLVHTR